MKIPLKQASKDYFEAQELTDSQLDSLSHLHNGKETRNTPLTTSKTYIKMALSLSACIAISLIIIFLNGYTNQNYSQHIANEVSHNHLKLKPLEINSTEFTTVKNYFKQLDFLPTASTHFNQQGHFLLGGRYCSIKSISAAQIRYKDPQQRIISLYEVPYNKQQFGEIPNIDTASPLTLYANGLTVTLWVEKGLLMAQVNE